MPDVLPLRRRPWDAVFATFFAVNLAVVTYMIDLEQLVIPDPAHFTYPLWPPAFMVDAVHWWGSRFDPALMAREPWWRATIWIDVLFFGPFYAAAIPAFVRGREAIRLPATVWAAAMITNVTVILFEEYLGRHATPAPFVMALANAPWLVMPALLLWRLGRRPGSYFARGDAR